MKKRSRIAGIVFLDEDDMIRDGKEDKHGVHDTYGTAVLNRLGTTYVICCILEF